MTRATGLVRRVRAELAGVVHTSVPRRDLVVPAGLLTLSLTSWARPDVEAGLMVRPEGEQLPLAPVWLLLVLLQTVPLVWRRSRPSAVLATVAATFLIDQWGGTRLHAGSFGIFFALAAVTMYAGGSTKVRSTNAATIAVTFLGTAGAILLFRGREAGPAFAAQATALIIGVPLVVGWIFRPRDRGRRKGRAGPGATRPVPSRPDPPGLALDTLSRRERDVLDLLVQGRTNAEIATELVIGRETVKSHVASILGKLGARDRLEVVIRVRDPNSTDAGAHRRHAAGE